MILSLLRIRAHAEGLEISDQVLRFVYIEGGVGREKLSVFCRGSWKKER